VADLERVGGDEAVSGIASAEDFRLPDPGRKLVFCKGVCFGLHSLPWASQSACMSDGKTLPLLYSQQFPHRSRQRAMG
jgi:hypothetical protein